jgi:exopolyphosphatase/pppGpp-phosphohydrolase
LAAYAIDKNCDIGGLRMEKVIYENESSKLVADASGGVVNLTQYFDGENVGTVAMYYEEVKELMQFLSTLNDED